MNIIDMEKVIYQRDNQGRSMSFLYYIEYICNWNTLIYIQNTIMRLYIHIKNTIQYTI